jgi:hypothetical protein
MKIRSRRPTKSSTSSKTPKRAVVRQVQCSGEGGIIEIWVLGKKVVTKARRWYKDVGLGFKTPSEAIQGTYIGASQVAFGVNWLLR